MDTNEQLIIIISGPSGVGKGTIIKEVVKKKSHLRIAISATTRAKRFDEQPSIDYYYLSEEEFNQKILNDEFLEWSIVHKNKYGTLKSEVEYYLNNRYDVILEIDIQGAHKIKKYGGNVVSIFISPPTFQDLIDRLHGRNTEKKDVIQSRLETANKELSAIGQYDFIVVNKDINVAINDVLEIINNTKKEIQESKGAIINEH